MAYITKTGPSIAVRASDSSDSLSFYSTLEHVARKKFQDFLVQDDGGDDADIAVGDWLVLDTAGIANVTGEEGFYVKKAAGSDALGSGVVVGVATEVVVSNTSPKKVTVQVHGKCTEAKVKTGQSIVAGQVLCLGTTEGEANKYLATATSQPCGVTLTAESGGTATVFIFNNFGF